MGQGVPLGPCSVRPWARDASPHARHTGPQLFVQALWRVQSSKVGGCGGPVAHRDLNQWLYT